MELASSVFAWADVDGSPAGFAAGINGSLDARASVIGFVASCAVIFDVEDGLSREEGAEKNE
jgi:hypothetical protein